MTDKYRISVDFVLTADSLDEAEDRINTLIDEGMLVLIDKHDELIDSYDITDSNPAEVEF